jgi:RNA polymerase sigma-70 factor (ECF subfamily)
MPGSISYSENELLSLVAAGDRQAFTRLYSQYLDVAYHYVYLFTKSKDEAEEILQEVFVKIWENREKLAEVQSFKNYLFKAAKNRVLDEVRKVQVRHRVFTEIKRGKTVNDETTTDTIAYKDYYRVVQQAIEKLPPKRKLIFRMNTENGLSHDEIAAQLGVSKSMVKNQLYKAYEFVRQYLSQHGGLSLPVILLLYASVC